MRVLGDVTDMSGITEVLIGGLIDGGGLDARLMSTFPGLDSKVLNWI